MILGTCQCHHILIWWSSYPHMMIIMLSYDDHHQTEKTQHMLYFWKGGDSRLSIMIFWCVILVIWWLSYNHLMIIMLSYDDHHQTEKTQHMIYFWKLGDSTISVCHSCPKMIIQQANLAGSVHILEPYTFQSEFCKVVHCLFWHLSHLSVTLGQEWPLLWQIARRHPFPHLSPVQSAWSKLMWALPTIPKTKVFKLSLDRK